MKYDSFSFAGVKTLDYRNARYHGFVSKENKRQGIGIVLDDDMNFYCSEWSSGKMSGNSLILLHDGRYFYGDWHQGQPHGANLFKNKKTLLFANFFRGQPKQTILAFYQPMNSIVCFNAQELQSKSSLQIISSQKLNNTEFYREYVSEVAKKHGILMSKQHTSIIDFMKKIAVRYAEALLFKQKGQNYFFGFENGQSIKFSISGSVNQHMNRVSVGHHIGQKLLQLGAKYYTSQCTQEGNFCTRQLIAYNKYSHRPRQKCNLIFQNTHRKGLNFQNQYFDMRSPIISQLQDFSSKKLSKKCEQIDQELRQMRKSSLSRSVTKKITQSKLIDQSSANLNKVPPHKNPGLYRQKSRQDLSLTPKKSKTNLLTGQAAISHKKLRTYGQQHTAVNQLVKHYNELRYQKTLNDKSGQSKDKTSLPSYNKANKLRQLTRSKEKPRNSISPARELKYLKNYKLNKQDQTEDNHSKSLLRKESVNTITANYGDQLSNKSKKNITKSPSKDTIGGKNRKSSQNNTVADKNRKSTIKIQGSMVPEPKEEKKLSQFQIQLKIRQQIMQQQRYRELKHRQMSQMFTPNLINQTNHMKSQLSSIVDQFALSPPQDHRKYLAYTPPKHLVELRGTSPNFDSYLQNLEDKREKILSQFRQMNRQIQIDFKYQRLPKPSQSGTNLNRNKSYQPPIHQHSFYTQFIESPNKHSENYLRQSPNYQDKLLPKLSNVLYKLQESPIHQQSLSRYPLESSNTFNFQNYEESIVKETVDLNKARKKKYQYLFE